MFIPQKPTDFIGKTQSIARVLFAKTDAFLANPKATDELQPFQKCLLFLGPPGSGKTTLALLLARRLTSEFAVEHINGRSLTLERVREWRLSSAFRPMHGDFHVKVIDEIDGATTAACDDIRTWLDCLPKRTIIIATTNKELEGLQEQLQSRFQQFPFEAVPAEEITNHLVDHIKLPFDPAKQIASQVKGNVRAALADAASFLDVMSLQAT